ncbi:MAG: hypothetical protein VW405_21395 [Rhodospirillaceae bacterium]
MTVRWVEIAAVLGYDGRHHLPGPAVGTSHCGAPSKWRDRWAFAGCAEDIPKACATCFPVSPTPPGVPPR